MVRVAGIIAAAGILPVIEDHITRRRNIGVVLNPLSELPEEFDHLLATTLGWEDVRYVSVLFVYQIRQPEQVGLQTSSPGIILCDCDKAIRCRTAAAG